MNKSESIINLVKATIKVTQEVKGIEKNLNVGTGNSSYKGVADQDVKKVVGDAMAKHGLVLYTTGIEETTKIDNWDEIDQWSKTTPKEVKRKQSVFTKVNTTYLLAHESGEYIEIKGYGHGVDSQDKSAGKATTYALKYALLYQFLIPTGKIDDADNDHSENKEIPKPKTEIVEKKPIVKNDEEKPFVDTVFVKATEKQLKEITELIQQEQDQLVKDKFNKTDASSFSLDKANEIIRYLKTRQALIINK